MTENELEIQIRRHTSRWWGSPAEEKEKALAEIRKLGEPAIDLLISWLEYKDSRDKNLAASLLGHLKVVRAIPHLAKAMCGEDDVRISAALAIGDIGDVAAIPHLLSLFKHEYPGVRSWAGVTMGWLGEPAMKAILRAMKNKDENVRICATHALSMIKTPTSIRHLIKALGDSRSEVRSSASMALQGIGEPAIVHLINALKNPALAGEAVSLLGEFHTEKAIGPLLDRLREMPDDIGTAEALGKIGAKAITKLAALVSQDRCFMDAALRASQVFRSHTRHMHVETGIVPADSGQQRILAASGGNPARRMRMGR